MYRVWGLVFVITFTRVLNAAASCVHVANDDILEYYCNGGTPADIMLLPDKVEKLKITNMRIPVVTTDIFSKFGPNLSVLICSYCEITDIEPDAFRTLMNLQQLVLDDNHLTIVRGSWFKDLKWLGYVDFTYNDITTVEDSVFENAPVLMDIRLSGNRLRCLNTNAMSNLGELRRLLINENPDFKCPNTVEQFLQDRGISLERDPEWKNFDEEVISAAPLPEPATMPNLPPVIRILSTTPFNPYTQENRAPYYADTERTSASEGVTGAPYPPHWFTTPDNEATTQVWLPVHPYPPVNSEIDRPDEATVTAETSLPTWSWRSTESPKIYWTSNMDDSFVESEYPIRSEAGSLGNEIMFTSSTLVPKNDDIQKIPLTVQPAIAEDFRVPPQESTVTMESTFRPNESRPTNIVAFNIESTTTDKPFPPCPPNSSYRNIFSKELIIILALFTVFRSIFSWEF